MNLYIFLAAVLAAVVTGLASVPLFNALPALWFTDYGVAPDEKLFSKRIYYKKEGLMLALALAFCMPLLLLSCKDFNYFVFAAVAVWALLLTAVADQKYAIIPDQFLLLAGAAAVTMAVMDLVSGKHVFQTSLLSVFLSLLIGSGALYLLGLLGKVLFKREEAMGFGDVKLLAVSGLLCGFPGIVMVLVISVLSSGIIFGLQMAAKKLNYGEYRPLGPYIVFATVFYMLFHNYIGLALTAYFSLYK